MLGFEKQQHTGHHQAVTSAGTSRVFGDLVVGVEVLNSAAIDALRTSNGINQDTAAAAAAVHPPG